MPIATIQYDLADEDDARAFHVSLQGDRLVSVLWDFDQHLREQTKFGDFPEPIHEQLVKVREKLHEQLLDQGIDLDMLSC